MASWMLTPPPSPHLDHKHIISLQFRPSSRSLVRRLPAPIPPPQQTLTAKLLLRRIQLDARICEIQEEAARAREKWDKLRMKHKKQRSKVPRDWAVAIEGLGIDAGKRDPAPRRVMLEVRRYRRTAEDNVGA